MILNGETFQPLNWMNYKMDLLDSIAVSNWFIKISLLEGKEITIMKTQRLLYFSHAWCLAIYDVPLLNEKVQAWVYGPVFPNVYDYGREYGSQPLNNYLGAFYLPVPMVDKNDSRVPLLQKIWNVYGGYSHCQLLRIANENGDPWKETRNKEKWGRKVEIDEELIKAKFREKMDKPYVKSDLIVMENITTT